MLSECRNGVNDKFLATPGKFACNDRFAPSAFTRVPGAGVKNRAPCIDDAVVLPTITTPPADRAERPLARLPGAGTTMPDPEAQPPVPPDAGSPPDAGREPASGAEPASSGSGSAGPDPALVSYALVSQVSFEMIGPLVIGIGLDYWLRWTMPWLSLVGVFLGFAGALTHLILIASRDTGPAGKPPGSRGRQ
jgi:hypothetical protein